MNNDKPRKLTDEEIQDILSALPDVRSAATEVSEQNTRSMKVLLREQLMDIELTPLGITDLKNEILRQYRQSVVRPGEMVGVLASDATSSKLTQASLNSFQSSGSLKTASSGVERISELINATPNPKHTSATIYFKDQHLAFDDIIIKKRPIITEITVKDLVIGVPDIESVDNIEEPEWYEMYRLLIRDDFSSRDVLRLNIDVNALYAYKITMEDVCNVIEQDGSVICVYSPMAEGKIDIYPIENAIARELQSRKIQTYESSGLIFLTMVVIPHLDKLKISGITGISQIYPVEAKVLQIIKEEREIKGGEKNRSGEVKRSWYLILNPIRIRITGITPEKLVKLCEVCGIEVVKVRPNYLTVLSDISPLKFLNDTVNEDEKREKEADKKERELNKRRGTKRETSDISKASKLIYADCTGSNLVELLADPEVDSSRTFCNDVHQIVGALGIEAGRTFLIKEFIDVINAEGYINPRHIVLLADYMSSLGAIYGVTFSGVSRQPLSALEKASFEKAMDVFTEASGFGERRSVSGTSASIFIGKKALIGTGYSESYIRPENLERYEKTRKELLEDANMTLDINSFNDAIQEFNIGSGQDVAVLEGQEEEMFGLGVGTEKEPEVEGKKFVVEKKVLQVEKTQIAESPIVSGQPLMKGKVIRSGELDVIAKKVEGEIEASVSCVISEPKPTFTVTQLPAIPKSTIFKPKPQPIKIFSLEEFIN